MSTSLPSQPLRARFKLSLLRVEPFRLFFPLSILASLVGVSLWPLVYGGWITFYPGEAHARLMIQGFAGGAALGFLGTAFPRFVEAPALTWPETGTLLAAFMVNLAASATGHIALGDAAFLVSWTLLMGAFAVRGVFLAKASPPPGFLLVTIGIAAALAGTTLLLIHRVDPLTPFAHRLALLLLQEAFLTCAILGVGSFLFARFFPDVGGEHLPPSIPSAAAAGILLLGSYGLQAVGPASLAIAMRCLLISGCLCQFLPPGFLSQRRIGTLGNILRCAVVCYALGPLLLLLAPDTFHTRIAVEHIYFIGGFGLLILAVASRVILGHSGQAQAFHRNSTVLRWVLGLAILGMLTRVVADLVPSIRVSHHIYAAAAWILTIILWSWALLRFVGRPDEEDSLAEENGPTEAERDDSC